MCVSKTDQTTKGLSYWRKTQGPEIDSPKRQIYTKRYRHMENKGIEREMPAHTGAKKKKKKKARSNNLVIR